MSGGTGSEKVAIRRALADYIASEGCSCCRSTERHEAAMKRLAKLLNIPMYADKSGYDYGRFETKRRQP
jgi:hypothetical protein